MTRQNKPLPDTDAAPMSSPVSSQPAEFELYNSKSAGVDLRRQLAGEYVARQDARASLASFMLHAGLAYPDLPAHARYICERIQRAFDDPDGPRVIVVCQPPGTLKTTIARGVVAWLLARDSGTRTIWATHRTDHALKQSRMILDLLRSPKYAALAPKTILSDRSQSQAAFETTHSPEPGGMVALGSGSGVRGYRADLIVLDDPAGSVQDAASYTVGETLIDWFERDLVSRLLPTGKVLLFAQRLTERDLPGYLMRRYANDPDMRMETITLQMRASDDMPCPLGRPAGALLWPSYFDEQTCRMLESESMRWQSEYQQQPPSVTGGVWCSPDDIEIVDKAPPDMALLAATDMALGESKGRGDYSVHLVGGLGPDRRLYIVDAWRSRDCDTLEAGDALIDLCAKHKPRHVLHEDSVIERSIMPALKDRARTRGIHSFKPHAVPNSGADKVARASALQSMIRSGRVAFLRGDWNLVLLKEWAAFPGRNDDSVDAANLFARVIDRIPAATVKTQWGTDPSRERGVPSSHLLRDPKTGASQVTFVGLGAQDVDGKIINPNRLRGRPDRIEL